MVSHVWQPAYYLHISLHIIFILCSHFLISSEITLLHTPGITSPRGVEEEGSGQSGKVYSTVENYIILWETMFHGGQIYSMAENTRDVNIYRLGSWPWKVGTFEFFVDMQGYT